MIGIGAFLNRLSFVVVPVALLVVVVYFARRTPKSKGTVSIRGGIATVVLLLLPIATGLSFLREVRAHGLISQLEPNQVKTITVGTAQIDDSGQISEIVDALRHCQWFSPSHGGWAEPVSLQISLRSGEIREYRVATYLREPGVVIELASGRPNELHAGYAFSSTLTSALSGASVTLPK
jgi:hypothetical protein